MMLMTRPPKRVKANVRLSSPMNDDSHTEWTSFREGSVQRYGTNVRLGLALAIACSFIGLSKWNSN